MRTRKLVDDEKDLRQGFTRGETDFAHPDYDRDQNAPRNDDYRIKPEDSEKKSD